MQVEVSKHTEGAKDKMLRPNGLPESLIKYDGISYLTHCLILSNSLHWAWPQHLILHEIVKLAYQWILDSINHYLSLGLIVS